MSQLRGIHQELQGLFAGVRAGITNHLFLYHLVLQPGTAAQKDDGRGTPQQVAQIRVRDDEIDGFYILSAASTLTNEGAC